MRFDAFSGRRVVILGYGREGQSAWRALNANTRPALLEVWTESGDLPGSVAGRVRAFDRGLMDFDLAVRSPGVRLDHPALARFRAAGGTIVNPSSIFLSERSDLPVVGVTGSKGKSTTASLLTHLLRAGGRDAELAGNIGLPLLDCLASRSDLLIAELSSYQLADLHGELHLGLITRLFPEHLDWHGSEALYYGAKLRMAELLHGRPLLINATDPILEAATRGFENRVLANAAPDYHREGDQLLLGHTLICDLDTAPLTGRHNLDNSALALHAASLLGGETASMHASLASFRPLAHRLETVSDQGGHRWINDSIATSPYATRAALESMRDQSVVLIVGGQDRPARWSPVVEWCKTRPLAGLITLPDNGASVAEALLEGGAVESDRVHRAEDLEQAVGLAAGSFVGGETILLSPGAPSFPRFRNFEERGERFRQAVEALCPED
jgi:UDP-N-acetylmuramoylalanine--D-glutamate ligase